MIIHNQEERIHALELLRAHLVVSGMTPKKDLKLLTETKWTELQSICGKNNVTCRVGTRDEKIQAFDFEGMVVTMREVHEVVFPPYFIVSDVLRFCEKTGVLFNVWFTDIEDIASR